jgi:uncharacterized protein (TIGR03086 family)
MTLIELYGDSVRAFADRVREIGPEQWTDPTPCADWDVRTLVNHIVYEQRWSVPLLAGATIAEVGDQYETDLLGDDPQQAVTDAAAAALAAAGKPGVLDKTVHLSFGDTPGEEYLRQLFADHLMHGWDLAVAIGGDRRLDPRSVSEVATWFAEREDMYRSSGVIGPRVEVPAGASEQDRLVAAFGRDPSTEERKVH